MIPPKWLATVRHRAGLTLFVVFVFFWVVRFGYCTYGYFTNGFIGVQSAIIHGALVPRDRAQWGHPRWDVIVFQYSTIALMTILLGLDNRSTIRAWLDAICHRQPTTR